MKGCPKFLCVQCLCEQNTFLLRSFLCSWKIRDKDLVKRRCGQLIDPFSGDIFTEDVHSPKKPATSQAEANAAEKKDEKDEDDDEEEEDEDGAISEVRGLGCAEILEGDQDTP